MSVVYWVVCVGSRKQKKCFFLHFPSHLYCTAPTILSLFQLDKVCIRMRLCSVLNIWWEALIIGCVSVPLRKSFFGGGGFKIVPWGNKTSHLELSNVVLVSNYSHCVKAISTSLRRTKTWLKLHAGSHLDLLTLTLDIQAPFQATLCLYYQNCLSYCLLKRSPRQLQIWPSCFHFM